MMNIETRNHQSTTSGAINCEFNHPEFGWIPFTAVEGDTVGYAPQVWAAVKDRTDITPASPPPAPARADVNAERDRRTAETFVFQGTTFDLDPASLQRITGAATLAGFAIGAGSPVGNLRWANASTDFQWIAKDNSKVSMDAQTAFAFGQAAANHVSAYVFAADEIKAMDPIPTDYTDDKWGL